MPDGQKFSSLNYINEFILYLYLYLLYALMTQQVLNVSLFKF